MTVWQSCLVAYVCVSRVAGASAQSGSEDLLSARVDEAVHAQMRKQKLPGVSLGVMRNGKIIKTAGYGLANVELNVKVTPRSIFQTGSVGKQFTATAVMMLVEDGKIGLDDKITSYFPEAPPAWKEITVRHLLTHTLGIPDYGGDEDLMYKDVINLHQDYTEDELVGKFAALPLNFRPGETWSYSNTGYVLLGVLIHRVTGKFYGDFLRERIFEPLGMNSTRIISEEDIIPNRSSGYRLVSGQLKNQDWVAPSLNTTADGALYTNVLDMAKWDAALYTDKLLKKASLDQMWTPAMLSSGQTSSYGFGWDINEVNGHRVLRHDGEWQGFTTNISRYVDDRLTIVVLTNLGGNSVSPRHIAEDVAAIYLPALKLPP